MNGHDGDGGDDERPTPRIAGDTLVRVPMGEHGEGFAESGAVTHTGEAVRGLTKQQRRFVALRLLHGTDAECAKAVGIHPGTVTNWKAESAEFRDAYDELWTHGLEQFAEKERRRLVGKALATADDLMDATTPVRTRDGVALDAAGDVLLVADHAARAKGSELALRANGLWNPAIPGGSGDPAALAAINALAELAREAQERRSRATSAGGVVVEGTSRPVDGD